MGRTIANEDFSLGCDETGSKPADETSRFMNNACQRCKESKATVFITDCFPEKRELRLCDECAEKEGVIVKQQETASAILHEFIKQKIGASKVQDITCPECGMTFREFQQKGQLGCPNDYSAFAEYLMPLIERAHDGATQHVGKIPSDAAPSVQKQAGLLRLRRELQAAIEQENYEQAAQVRDRIKSLEDV